MFLPNHSFVEKLSARKLKNCVESVIFKASNTEAKKSFKRFEKQHKQKIISWKK